ncbi:MAG: LacI family DNA-binding transcriptional regulator [Mediterraneibacter gnavus]
MAEVKLKDIAQAAGVSTVTVSQCAFRKAGVSNDVREKIEEIARNMGYDFSRYEKRSGYRIGVIASEMYMEMGTSFY